MPVAFATCGIEFGPIRCQLEIFARMPVRSASSPRYAPHGHDMIATSTGLPRDDTPSWPAPECDRTQVALRQPVRADEIPHCGLELVARVRQLHVEEPRRVLEPVDVLGQPEDGGAPRRLVRPDAFEDTRAVMQPVRADVNGRVGPVDELAVHPDLRGLLHARNGTQASDRSRPRPGSRGRCRAARGRPGDSSSRRRPRPSLTEELTLEQHPRRLRDRERGDRSGLEAGAATHLVMAATRAYRAPAAAAIFSGSARRSPGRSASTGRPRR